jgi:hypothetical protein
MVKNAHYQQLPPNEKAQRRAVHDIEMIDPGALQTGAPVVPSEARPLQRVLGGRFAYITMNTLGRGSYELKFEPNIIL